MNTCSELSATGPRVRSTVTKCTVVLALNKLCGRPPQYAPAPCKLTFDPLTLKVVSESRVTWATSEPILVFLGLSVLDLGPMYATDTNVRQTDRQTDRCQTASSFNAPPRGHKKLAGYFAAKRNMVGDAENHLETIQGDRKTDSRPDSVHRLL